MARHAKNPTRSGLLARLRQPFRRRVLTLAGEYRAGCWS